MITPEQQTLWDVLSADPARLSHTYGLELKSIKNKDQFHRRVDELLYFIMANFNNEGVIRTVKTWLSVYKLPLEPAKLQAFDKFHKNYGHLIIQRQHKTTFESYESENSTT